jgi:hypothetical protein
LQFFCCARSCFCRQEEFLKSVILSKPEPW